MSVSTTVTPYRLVNNNNKHQLYSDDDDDECIVKKTSGDFASSYPCDDESNKQMMEVPPPQPMASQSMSRLKNAFQRLRGGNSVSIAPAEIIKPTPSKSSSLAEKIKIKFQYNHKKKEHRMMRSTSFSNAWSKWGTKPMMVRSTSVYMQPQQEQQIQQIQQIRRKSHHHKRKVSFAKLVSVRETFSRVDYDRVSDPYAICNRLTPVIAQQIKEELNAYKLHEMQVHEYSRIHTHFFI